jgi:hypothetical protein
MSLCQLRVHSWLRTDTKHKLKGKRGQIYITDLITGKMHSYLVLLVQVAHGNELGDHIYCQLVD